MHWAVQEAIERETARGEGRGGEEQAPKRQRAAGRVAGYCKRNRPKNHWRLTKGRGTLFVSTVPLQQTADCTDARVMARVARGTWSVDLL